MSFIKSLFSKEPRSLYCQFCRKDLTNEGGDISGTGRIYCHGYMRADGQETVHGISAMLDGIEPMEILMLNYYT